MESSTVALALATGTVTAEIKQVLNQPITFSVGVYLQVVNILFLT